MSTNVSIEVTGVKEALRELNSMDKSARRQLTRDYRQIVQPVLTDAERYVPNEAPMSGWNRTWNPRGGTQPVLPLGASSTRTPKAPGATWAQSSGGRRRMANWMKWEAKMRPYISGKRPQSIGGFTRNLSAFGVHWLSPTSVLFDTAGQATTPQGEQMIKVLQQRFGQPSRVMWKAWESADDDVIGGVKDLVEDLMFRVNQKVRL